MKFLLDTHFFYWIPVADRRLSRAVQRLLNDRENEFLFSAASLWEIVLKREEREENYPYDPGVIRRQMLANGYEELPVLGEHSLAVSSLPQIHKDPFDRLLIAQAIVEGVTLLTADQTIARYPGPIRKI